MCSPIQQIKATADKGVAPKSTGRHETSTGEEPRRRRSMFFSSFFLVCLRRSETNGAPAIVVSCIAQYKSILSSSYQVYIRKMLRGRPTTSLCPFFLPAWVSVFFFFVFCFHIEEVTFAPRFAPPSGRKHKCISSFFARKL